MEHRGWVHPDKTSVKIMTKRVGLHQLHCGLIYVYDLIKFNRLRLIGGLVYCETTKNIKINAFEGILTN